MTALQAPLIALERSGPAFALRDYQEEAIAACIAGWDRGLQRLLIVMATGAGKTVVFSHLVHRMGCRTLVLAHREELIDQAAGKLRAVLDPGTAVGIVKAERNEVHAHVLVGSIQTMSGSKRLAQLPRDIGLVIVDEAHHSAASTYRKVLEGLGCFRAGGPVLLGVTATPDRGDGASIARIYQEQVYERSMWDLIDADYLCDIRAKVVQLAVSLAQVKTSAGDFQAEDLAKAIIAADGIPHVVAAYQRWGENRKALAFTPTVKMAHAMAAKFREAGIAAEAIEGTTHPELRRATLRRLSTGETQVVCNCAVLTEGFDEPSVSCLIIARPTKSRPLFVQMLGRGLRTFPGKQDCLVLDLVDNAGKHDVASIPDVFGLPKEAKEFDSLKKAVEEERIAAAERKERYRVANERAALVAKDVQLMRRSGLHWVPVEAGGKHYMALSLGDGRLLKVGQTAEGWAVVLNAAESRARLLVRFASKEGAMREAERHARQHGRAWAYLDGMRWRAEPVKQKTRVFARAIGCALPAGCTAGDASDRILVHQCIHGIQEPKSEMRYQRVSPQKEVYNNAVPR